MPKKKKRKLNYKGKIIVAAPVVAVAAISAFLLLRPDPFAQGHAYLQAQSEKELAPIESVINQKKMQRLADGIADGSMSVFTLFRNSMLFGDSRVYGFDAFGLVPGNQVMAEAGDTILNITDHLEEVKEMQPETIYFSYGVNDMGLGIGSDRGEDGYRQVYEEQIQEIQKAAPQAKIVINSIIHASPDAVDRSPAWGQTDAYNAQLKAMCEENGWIYVDNDLIDEGGNGNIYSGDGVHFSTPFYSLWSENMAKAVLAAGSKS